jgi:prophage tail gpP-like protein
MILKIDDRFHNRKIDFFNSFQMELKHNSVASNFSFDFYFDPNNPEHKELSCVTHFHDVTLEHNGELLITGVLINQGFSLAAEKELAQFGGYSRPGALEDCQIPPAAYPLQNNGLTVAQIARRVISPFRPNIDLVIDPDVSAKANKSVVDSTAGETETVKSYLAKLCKNRNIILSHDNKGNLLFTESKQGGETILDFDSTGGKIPGVNFSLNYNGQAMHSHIIIKRQSGLEGGNSGETTIRNPYVVGSVYRPKVTNQTSGDDITTSEMARRELSNELRNLTLTIELDRWEDKNGNIIKPNTEISIISPELYIWNKTRFFVESVTLRGNESSNTATIKCVLPDVYNTKPVQSIFRNINIHPRV